MGKFIDLTGQRFGKWVVIERAGAGISRHMMWYCKCDCGVKQVIDGTELRAGKITRCKACSRKTKVRDLLGKKFGEWTVIRQVADNKQGATCWECHCSCGSVKILRGGTLTAGRSTRCKKCRVVLQTKHNLSSHPLFSLWVGIKQRCHNPKDTGYHNYGARGIAVCELWYESPEYFLPWAEKRWFEGSEIDRKDNDKGYSPENCRFITSSENKLNSRRLRSTNTSGYRGVSCNRRDGGFNAEVRANNVRYRLGRFATAEEAAMARDLKCIELNLHTPLNFPELKK